jgi:hypothetical protein
MSRIAVVLIHGSGKICHRRIRSTYTVTTTRTGNGERRGRPTAGRAQLAGLGGDSRAYPERVRGLPPRPPAADVYIHDFDSALIAIWLVMGTSWRHAYP